MIGIDEDDCDVLRFLWYQDPFNQNSEVVHLRFTRLVFGLCPSPAILGAVIAQHCEKYKNYHSNLTDKLSHSLYADDLITGQETVEDAYELYQQAKLVMSEGGCNLRKWNTNSTQQMMRINASETTQIDKAPERQDIPNDNITSESDDQATISKLLGITWNSQTDGFLFKLNNLKLGIDESDVSKQSLLRITASIFDPLGFLSPFIITLKILFQVLCTNKIDWDEPLTGDDLASWASMMAELQLLSNCRVKRCYYNIGSKVNKVELHGFCDASEKAYAAVLYLQSDGHASTHSIVSKARDVPTKKQTIPRLELLGTPILSRLVNTVLPLIPQIKNIYCWTDSMTVLQWIKNNRCYRQYVQHRVDEIHRVTPNTIRRHCPGINNPAVLPSRGVKAEYLINSHLWWSGLFFLQEPDSKWPVNSLGEVTESVKAEMVRNPPVVIHSLVSNVDTINEHMYTGIAEVMQANNYSSFTRLLRVTAYVLRFIHHLKVLVAGNSVLTTSINLQAEDLT